MHVLLKKKQTKTKQTKQDFLCLQYSIVLYCYSTKIGPTLRLDVMSLPVDCKLQVSNHKTYVIYGMVASDSRFMVTCLDIGNPPEVTSHLILKSDSVHGAPKTSILILCTSSFDVAVCTEWFKINLTLFKSYISHKWENIMNLLEDIYKVRYLGRMW